ncbi:membrane copper amine oxidase [Penicillium odoratum]|uniref:membrane copper amine oxidase n=1 Tax=Penicillium odoratum TaxID=1167516 RepID=UPI002548ADA1|nr:membrane copper amine oxidase [Penicillium odoratum]KAJ5745952.1 membrane copper amine oxidase [Penicillium odoratum]
MPTSSWYLTVALGLTILVNPTAGRLHADLRRPSPKQKHDSRRDLYQGLGQKLHDRSFSGAGSCHESNFTKIQAPKKNIWTGLTDPEAASVLSWLFEQTDLNLTLSKDAGDWDNTVELVELMQPNKTNSLHFIDHNGKEPPRYAHVVIDHRATVEPYYADILIGPLPIVNRTTQWQPLEYPYTRKTQGRIRNVDPDDTLVYDTWLLGISTSVADITRDLWNATYLGLDNDTISLWGIDPLSQENGHILRWDQFWHDTAGDFDSSTLLPLGLYVHSDVTGRDASKWKVLGWLYNDIFYPSTEDFRNAFYSPGFEKLGANSDGEWAHTDQRGKVLPHDRSYPPVSVAPSGSRFGVDVEQKYVEWMDFTFYISFSHDVGMTLHDIRYKGQRILYELGLQEALAHYAGNDPVQSMTSYLDSYYGFGPYAFELAKGYDCPSYATYLNSTFYEDETTHTHIHSICLFEYDADYPMQRHSSSYYVSVTKNVYFTVRSVSTVGNYDYMFSYSFYMDGSIGVEVRASGYIQSAYYAHNEDFGYHIHDALSGSMHDHVLNFKADFDILGLNNTIQLTKQIPTTQKFAWSNQTRNTMKIEHSNIKNEDESRFNWAANSATQVKVLNLDETTPYGEYRGYRILPSTGTIHLTVENSTNLRNAAQWANYDIQVTQHHDTEPRSAHPKNSQDVEDPAINFNKFFNGENLTQQDLVVWLNLGMHHVPHTGDLPNTVFTTAHSGVQFMPLNYLLGDPSRETVNMVRVVYDDGNVSAVHTFGQHDDQCTLDFTPAESSLWDYVGDVVVRKFPYDPNDPYFDTDSIS